jgi:O-acetyl-ADP-ribose deacetylase (regulator of RNase III)
MPIIFVSLDNHFIHKMSEHGYQCFKMKIEEYKCVRKTYYVSPANSLCFMDGGIDLALSRKIFPGIEQKVKQKVKELSIKTKLGRNYLPIGSSIIMEPENGKGLVVAPTMLLPQDVSNTKNAYYATMAVVYNLLVNKKEDLVNIDIIFTSLCCGYGKMDIDESINQIILGIKDYHNYNPRIVNENIIINEPNLLQQPKYYQNTEWFDVNPQEIVKII